MGSITCPMCETGGYISIEKGRGRVRIAHNNKINGKWKSKFCYLGNYKRSFKILDKLVKIEAIDDTKYNDLKNTIEKVDIRKPTEELIKLMWTCERIFDHLKSMRWNKGEHRYPRACPKCGKLLAIHIESKYTTEGAEKKCWVRDVWLQTTDEKLMSGRSDLGQSQLEDKCPYCKKEIIVQVDALSPRQIYDISVKAWKIY